MRHNSVDTFLDIMYVCMTKARQTLPQNVYPLFSLSTARTSFLNPSWATTKKAIGGKISGVLHMYEQAKGRG